MSDAPPPGPSIALPVDRPARVVSFLDAFGRVARSYCRGAGLRFGKSLPDTFFPVTLHHAITLVRAGDVR